jgi:hypothetical protein
MQATRSDFALQPVSFPAILKEPLRGAEEVE